MNLREIERNAESKHSLHAQQKAVQDERFAALERRCKTLEIAMESLLGVIIDIMTKEEKRRGIKNEH